MNETLPSSFQLRLPEPLLPLIQKCEVICVAGCCGMDAFDHEASHMIPWFRENPEKLSLVLDQLSHIIRLVCEQPGSIWSDEYEFNAIWPTASECTGYFREWRVLIHRAAESALKRTVPSINPDWRTSTVVALARGIYDERAFDRLPILADALQDAGCDNADVLTHCRDAGPHARGCWVVDLVLDKG